MPSVSGVNIDRTLQTQLLAQNQMMLEVISQMTNQSSIQMSKTPRVSATVSRSDETGSTEASNSVDFADLVNVDELSCAGDRDDRTDYNAPESGSIHDISSDEEDFDSAEMLSDIEHFYAQTDVCDNGLDTRLASMANSGIQANLSRDKRKELLKKHHRPENCGNIIVPLINKSIWQSLPSRIKNKDNQLRMPQTYMCTAMYPLLQLTDSLLKGSKGMSPASVKDCLSLANDVFRILQVGFSDITYRRREALKPSLEPAYRALCSMDNMPSQWLLGDNLEEKIKELTDAQKISRKIGVKSGSQTRMAPYPSRPPASTYSYAPRGRGGQPPYHHRQRGSYQSSAHRGQGRQDGGPQSNRGNKPRFLENGQKHQKKKD